MDYLRSCYSTDMRFSDGGSSTNVKWFFAPTGALWFTDRHRFASLNYWKGDWDASDTTAGEVVGAPRPWRDGSLPAAYDGGRFAGTTTWADTGCTGHPDLTWGGSPAMPVGCVFTPHPPCLSVPYANYNNVEFSPDGITWTLLPNTSGGDNWSGNIIVFGRTWTIHTDCGGIISGAQSLRINETAVPSNTTTVSSSGYSASFPATWTFTIVPGSLIGWSAVTVYIRTRTDGAIQGSSSATTHLSPSLTIAAPGSPIAGDSDFIWFNQQGITGGGSIVSPTLPAGWSALHLGPGNINSLWWRSNASTFPSVSISGLGNPDNVFAIRWISRTRPGTSIITSNYRDAQPANTILNAGSLTFSGLNASLFGMWRQQRQAATPVSVSTYGTFGTPMILGLQGGTNDGLAPPYNMVSACMAFANGRPAGTPTAQCVASQSLSWASGFIIIR